MSIETLKGLYLLETLSAPVPGTVTQYLYDNFATGTGPYGSFTVMDFLGTAAGVNIPNQMLQVSPLIDAMDVAVLQGLYNDMLATVSGTYGANTGPVTIPAGPAAGVYATGDLAFTTGLIPAAQAEIANLIAAYPTETGDLNNIFNRISEQIFREAVNQAKAGINYDELSSSSQSSAMSFASSLAQYGQDNTPSNSAEFLNTVAQLNTLPGQAIIGSLREGRNYQSLNEAGILSTNFAVPSTYPGDSIIVSNNVLTPLPPVQPPIIPAPPQNQPATNPTSTDYTVEEAIARSLAGNAPINSDTRSLPPPVDPGPIPVPPTPSAPPKPRPAFSPPRSVDGPTIRLNKSGSSALPGQLTVITADVFIAAINDYPIGTKVPYTITGIDPSKVSAMTVQSITAEQPGIPLDGTFTITSTRQGYFGIVVSTDQREDVIITIDVQGAKTYLGITPLQAGTDSNQTVEFLGYFADAPISARGSIGANITNLEATKPFWIWALASSIGQGSRVDGSLSVESGPGFRTRFSQDISWSPYQIIRPADPRDRTASDNATMISVPATAIREPGPAKITLSVEGRYSNSAIVNVIPPEFPRQIILYSKARQRISNGDSATNLSQVQPGEVFSILVTGPINTTFVWTGLGETGTTATDANGNCVFPEVKAPPSRGGGYWLDAPGVTYEFTVTWPDGEVTTRSLLVKQ
jgi:hypothetical protein